MTQAGDQRSHNGGIYGSAIAAEGWQRVTTRAFLRPITERMLDLAGINSGHRVLDVAAGTGEQTLMAARRVGPSGFVLATDIAERMVCWLCLIEWALPITDRLATHSFTPDRHCGES